MNTLQRSLERTPLRPLPIALAHCYAAAKPGRDNDRLAVFDRVFLVLTPADQARCRAELFACRRAKRGETLAEVA